MTTITKPHNGAFFKMSSSSGCLEEGLVSSNIFIGGK